ncbi:MAG TPA: hypothetical protein VGS80_23315 [Ktedonobacterales bacterium]|nr:hypothetical protein [Ktedonobacterales bacterium]
MVFGPEQTERLRALLHRSPRDFGVVGLYLVHEEMLTAYEPPGARRDGTVLLHERAVAYS